MVLTRSIAFAFFLATVDARHQTPRCKECKFETYKSPPVKLKTGQIANTNANDYPLEFPKGSVAIRHFTSRVVDEDGNGVPLNDLYVHHWLIFNGGMNAGMCASLPNIWGIGAELNGVRYEYPAPYAFVTTGTETWSANLHFIRTGPNVTNVQDCIECRCADADPPLHPHGSVGCCMDQSQCYGMEDWRLDDSKNYYLEYEIGYVPVTADVVPLSIYSFDVTSTHTTDCLTQYDVPKLLPGQNDTRTNTNVVPTDMNITFMEVHQHIGGIGFSVEHLRNGHKIGDICSVAPIYGTGTGVGNEKDYVVDIPTCEWSTGSLYPVKKGDELKLTSVYSGKTLPGGNPWHGGVMGLVFLAAVATPDPQAMCLTALHDMCGPPVYDSGQACLSCAKQAEKWLHGCTEAWVRAECAKNHDDGNFPPPPSVSGMHFHILPADGTKTRFQANLTCPSSGWCGIGVHTDPPQMFNSTAFTYVESASGKMVLQQRTLGNHNPGTVEIADYPMDVTVVDGVTHILFNITNQPSNQALQSLAVGGYNVCILFAQGANELALQYHGSARGFSCL
jgi:hypothetical protein